MCTIYRSIYAIQVVQFLCKSRHSVHTMYTISSLIFTVLDIRLFCKYRHSAHIMYTISHSTYAVLDTQFLHHPVMQYIYTVHNFSLNIRISGYSIFLLIQTFCTNNVHNFPLNFNNSRY